MQFLTLTFTVKAMEFSNINKIIEFTSYKNLLLINRSTKPQKVLKQLSDIYRISHKYYIINEFGKYLGKLEGFTAFIQTLRLSHLFNITDTAKFHANAKFDCLIFNEMFYFITRTVLAISHNEIFFCY